MLKMTTWTSRLSFSSIVMLEIHWKIIRICKILLPKIFDVCGCQKFVENLFFDVNGCQKQFDSFTY